MEHDGTRNGFAVDLVLQATTSVNIPVIASGGAGTIEHFSEVFISGKADAALAASIFHFREISIPELKRSLFNQGIPIRI